jgi:hypothetical protein
MQFDSSSRALGRRHWTPPLHRRRLVKARQRIAHPLPARRRQAQNKIAKGRLPGAVSAF